MQHFEFELILDDIDLNEPYEDPLFEAGCDDGLVSTFPVTLNGESKIRCVIHFAREASSLLAAVDSAIKNVISTGASVVCVAGEFDSATQQFLCAQGIPCQTVLS